jgi:AraC-like DNA-binding protein
MRAQIEPNNCRESLIRARSSSGLDGQTRAAHTRAMKIPLAHDPLGEALHFLRMSGVFYCRSEFTAPWALDLPAFEDCLMFHVVTSGRCVLDVKGSDDHVL